MAIVRVHAITGEVFEERSALSADDLMYGIAECFQRHSEYFALERSGYILPIHNIAYIEVEDEN